MLFGFTYGDYSSYPFAYARNDAYMLKVHKLFATLVDGQRAHQNNGQHSFSHCKSAGFQITRSSCCIAILLHSWWAISSSKHCVSSGSELQLRMPIDYQRRLTFIITGRTQIYFPVACNQQSWSVDGIQNPLLPLDHCCRWLICLF